MSGLREQGSHLIQAYRLFGETRRTIGDVLNREHVGLHGKYGIENQVPFYVKPQTLIDTPDGLIYVENLKVQGRIDYYRGPRISSFVDRRKLTLDYLDSKSVVHTDTIKEDGTFFVDGQEYRVANTGRRLPLSRHKNRTEKMLEVIKRGVLGLTTARRIETVSGEIRGMDVQDSKIPLLIADLLEFSLELTNTD